MTTELLGIITLLLASGFFSSSEIGFILSNKLKIEIRARGGKLSSKNSFYFLNNPQIFFSSILISNNVINTAFASLLTVFLSFYFGLNDFPILIISTISLFLVGELIPKLIATEFPDSIFQLASTPIRLFTIVLYPFVWLTSFISGIVTGKNSMNERGLNYILHRDDIHSLITESSEAGYVDEQNTDIIKNVLEMSNQRVSEVMTPRTDIVGLEINSTIDEALKLFIESGYSKLPIYKESLDHIKGIVLAYDMFKKPESIKSILREIPYIPETKKSMNALNDLLAENFSMAIVVDEFGGTAGIVTVEDVIEEMVGEINDEFDEDELVNKKIDDNTFLFSGKTEIDIIKEDFGISIPEGEYETIAGYITSEIGRIPKRGEKIVIGKLICEIMFSDKTKIELVKIKIKN